MGETGENNLEWLQAAFQLYDDCGMSWNLWPWKKLDTVTSPCSINTPAGWDDLVACARGHAAAPAPDVAWDILTAYLDSLPVARCTYRNDVVNAVMHRAPLRLPAWGFSFRGKNVSYDAATAKPLSGFRADDLVTLECASLGPDAAPRFDHKFGEPRAAEDAIVVCLTAGDWISFDVDLVEPAPVQHHRRDRQRRRRCTRRSSPTSTTCGFPRRRWAAQSKATGRRRPLAHTPCASRPPAR